MLLIFQNVLTISIQNRETYQRSCENRMFKEIKLWMPPIVSYSPEKSTPPILTVTVTELPSFLGHCSFNNPITTPERGCTCSQIWISYTSHLCPSLSFKSLDNHIYTHCLMDFSKGGKLILKKKRGGPGSQILCTAETYYWHIGQKQTAQNITN